VHDNALASAMLRQYMTNRPLQPRTSGRHDITILDDPQDVARHVAAWLVDRLTTGAQDTKAVCLTGGLTPLPFYQTLTRPPYAQRIPWARIHWFWCDERWVPPTHERSNFGMVRRALFAKVSVARQNIHPIPTHTGTPLEAAERYEKELKVFYGADVLDPARPLFDVTFLGIGQDGHTASLFPGSPVLEERTRWVRAVVDAKPEARITLTYPALESSGDLAFLVTGSAKRNTVNAVLGGSRDFPVSRVRPVGRLHWFVDRATTG
jgi:6-phosphogluconolactonase